MTWPQVYALFPGTAREALTFYAEVFGGELSLHSYEEFSRTDGPPDAIAHGQVTGRVTIFGADATPGEQTALGGVMLTILGEEPELQTQWFARLSDEGRVLAPLEQSQ
jgi:PhnB protein